MRGWNWRAQPCAECERLRQELERQRRATEWVVDNALFAAGAAPVFDPGHERFRPRAVEAQQGEAAAPQRPLTLAEWRREIERLDQEVAARDRRGQMAEELKRLAEERKQHD
jgi:hypothetical protein